jgi:Cu-Zn family superoxide dismutase
MQKFLLGGLMVGGTLFAGCHGGIVGRGAPQAEATLQPMAGSKLSGRVWFSQSGDKVRVVAEVHGLTPGGHGFHVHEKGDCSAPDGSSAGGHFNPGGMRHGSPDLGEHHAGDMPQLIANADGTARLTAYLEGVSVGGEVGDLVGRSVVVHAAADDFASQPAGNSGGRLACGLIVRK